MVLAGAAAIFLLIIVVYARRTSTIVIDSKGISRSAFGLIWQKIAWDNVQRITVLPYRNPVANKAMNLISIRPKIKPPFYLWPSQDMGFSDQIENADQLRTLLNNFIARENIAVDLIVNGISTNSSHIDAA